MKPTPYALALLAMLCQVAFAGTPPIPPPPAPTPKASTSSATSNLNNICIISANSSTTDFVSWTGN